MLLAIDPAAAQPPALPAARLHALFPAGAKLGTTVDVAATGTDLDEAAQLQFTDPGIAAEQKMGDPGFGQTGPQPVAGQFRVTIKPDVKPGVYEVRALGKYGLSNPRAFVVGIQDEIVEKEPNNSIKQATEVPLGGIVNGRSEGAADLDFFKFTAKKGQRVLIDCWAYRIDSRMDATLVLYNAAGVELQRDRDTNRRDPLVDIIIPADGDYFVELHDFLYVNSSENFYRLSISLNPYIDYIFPPAGPAGTSQQYTLFGRNLPGGQPVAGLMVNGHALESLAVQIALPSDPSSQSIVWGSTVEPAESVIDAVEYRLSGPQGTSNPALVGIATAPVVVEQEPNDNPQQATLLTPPCEHVGRFYPRGDRDWVSFQAKKGDVYWVEVTSHRLGLPTDPFLLIQQVSVNDKGEETVKDITGTDDTVGSVGGAYFDTTTGDPQVRFEAPADGLYRLLVRDFNGTSKSDPRCVYRLAIRPPQPDFRLVAVPRFPPINADAGQNPINIWSPVLRKGGSDLIDVYVFRRDGFDGPVEVSASGLPAGVTAPAIVISPPLSQGSLVLTAADDAVAATSLMQVAGKAIIADKPIERVARTAAMIWGGVQNESASRSRVTQNLALTVLSSESAPFSLSAGKGLVLEMSRAGQVKIPIELVRRGDFKGNVALSAPGLPPNLQPKNMNLEADKAVGEFEIGLPPNSPLGTYSFFVLGSADVNYAHKPEALKAATERKAAVEKIVAERAAAAKAAADAKGPAEQKFNEAKAASQKAAEVLKTSEAGLVNAQTEAQGAAEKAKQAQAAAEKDTANQDLANARQAADKTAAEAAAKVVTAGAAKAAAEKAVAEATAAVNAATEAKAAAEKAAADTDNASKQVAQFLQTFNQSLNDLQNKSRPQNRKVGVASTPVTLKITAAPITLGATPPATAVKQGTKLELPVTITRLYGHADPVRLRLAVPNGVAGLSAPEATIAQEALNGSLVVDVGKDATVGAHRVSVLAIARFNGQELQVDQQLTLTVEKTEPPK